jgi:deoxyribonuclease-4
MKSASKIPRRLPSNGQLLGAHTSTAGGFHLAVERAVSIGCTAMQIFVKNNMQWFAGGPLLGPELERYHAAAGALGAVFGHSGYMINLAATNPEFLEKSRRALIEELTRADALRLPFLVLHPGAHMGAGLEPGLQTVVQSLDEVFKKAPHLRTRVALETTAGQGSCLGAEFEHLAYILANVREPERLCVCVDTAHLFEAGYDISTAGGAQAVFAKFHKIIGREHLAALHLNDSKTALGSRVDRHEHIGKGQIGLEAFRYIMTAPNLAKVPKVLETPKGKEMLEDVENLAVLRRLAAG